MDLGQPMLQDIGEADQDGQIDAAHLQPVDKLLQVDRPLGVLVGVNQHVAVLAD